MDTLETIKELAARQFGIEDPATIDVNVPVDQLGADSLGFLEFLFELEDRFKMPIPQEAVVNVKTLSDLAGVIDGLLAAAAATPLEPAAETPIAPDSAAPNIAPAG
jgi:acyl carrier protein